MATLESTLITTPASVYTSATRRQGHHTEVWTLVRAKLLSLEMSNLMSLPYLTSYQRLSLQSLPLNQPNRIRIRIFRTSLQAKSYRPAAQSYDTVLESRDTAFESN